jgi:eukaryotic-like serine/threonine-protein kinase
VNCEVPRLVGKTLRAARTALAANACRLGKVTLAYSQSTKGKVIGQKPKAGMELAENAKVNVTVSKGPRPKPKHKPKPKHLGLF